jgi:hypothetical protein
MSPADALDTEYENGIADILEYLADASAVVKRNVHLPGKLSGVQRQVDVLVQGKVYANDGSTLVVDAKRWRAPVDVADVGSFIDLVRDVGAGYGLLVTNSGSSPGGMTRARSEGSVQVDVLPVEQLLAWRPPGTFAMTFGVPPDALQEATRVLRRAGFRVAESTQWAPSDESAAIEIFRHFGSPNPAADIQGNALSTVQRLLASRGITGTLITHGLTVGGGTPNSRWLELTVSGEPSGLKILADTEADADQTLGRIAASHGVQKEQLGYIRPPGWPGTRVFPTWGVGPPTGP